MQVSYKLGLPVRIINEIAADIYTIMGMYVVNDLLPNATADYNI